MAPKNIKLIGHFLRSWQFFQLGASYIMDKKVRHTFGRLVPQNMGQPKSCIQLYLEPHSLLYKLANFQNQRLFPEFIGFFELKLQKRDK